MADVENRRHACKTLGLIPLPIPTPFASNLVSSNKLSIDSVTVDKLIVFDVILDFKVYVNCNIGF